MNPAFSKNFTSVNLRNTNKKLNATARVDAIIAENPGKTLEELVALKKINADQKAQALKKPALQETVAHIEEQIAQYKQLEAYYEEQQAKEKTKLETQHKEELESLKKSLVVETEQNGEKRFKERLLVLSRFLRAAAAMRGVADEHSVEGRGFEGSLYQVYGGTEQAVEAMIKLIDGAEEKVPSVESELLDITYAQIKRTSLEYIQPTPEAAWTEEQTTAATTTASALQTDPTVANAGLTEAQDPSVSQAAATNGFQSAAPPHAEEPVPAQATTQNVAANELAQARSGAPGWDSNSMTASAVTEEWVNVQIPAAETAPPASAAPETASRPPLQTTDSWAEDVPAAAASTDPTKQPVDGFERVHHTRGRGRGYRGRGQGQRGGGEHRGRGGFNRGGGEFRGRGRGRGGEYRGNGNGNGHRGRPAQATAAPAAAGDA
ncbi:uncharacterized protein GIQ15_02864 [Arthroderma uncinatum]|uniref:uncharacterized protein n=1 Tax=Arthroderma uncinatum TaxID=74035 RepID=UPI00144ADF08|nr:uncharacterized protein GIQ15_02864 [Arthroderma uncinatum]KAF3483540.1 hypothetical protein GIQ15_02864 [Arthroderma uncinatum]